MDDPRGYTYNMMGNNGGWMTAFAVFALVLLIVAVLAVLANLVLHVSSGRRPGHPTPSTPSTPSTPEARALLDARLARGEVPAEEYRVLRELLDS